MSRPVGTRDGRHAKAQPKPPARVTGPIWDAGDEEWMAKIVESSPLVNPEVKRAYAEAARALQLQVWSLKARQDSLTGEEGKQLERAASRLDGMLMRLKVAQPVFEDKGPI